MSHETTVNGDLSLRNIVQIKGDQTVLNHLSLDLHPGELIALLGPNGAGKSSLLEICAGLGTGYSGEVILNHQLLQDMHAVQRSQKIGFLPQRSEIAWPLDVATFVGLGRLPYQSRWINTQTTSDQKAISSAISKTGIEMMRERSIETLSGGELSRVLLARVLAGEPEWLMLDEPMTGLDPGHQFELCDLLRKLASEGKGIIVTLHDLSLAAHLADRILLLNEGKIVADGTPREILTSSRIQEVYGVACNILETINGFCIALSPDSIHTKSAIDDQ